MVRVGLENVPTLGALYSRLVQGQQLAHGADYCSHHAAIFQTTDRCRSYAELGVNQGTTLAAAILAGFETCLGVDADLSRLDPCRHLFEQAPGVTLLQQDSRVPLNREVDFLLIDSCHTPGHFREELRAQGPLVRKCILAHDTWAVPRLHVELAGWAVRHGWKIQHRDTRPPGWTLIIR